MRVIENNNPEVENQAPYQEAEKVATKEDTPQTMEGTEKAINKAKRSCTISDKMINLLLTQLRGELSNYTLYNTFAVYYGCNGLTKLKEYWLARANEEKMHHEWIRNYLISCNVIFEYPEVPAVNVNVDDNLTPFKDTVDREIETTGGINNIVNEAIKEGDHATAKFLNGSDDSFGMLVQEQIEEQKISMDVYNIAKQDTDWLTKQDTIYDMYFSVRPK